MKTETDNTMQDTQLDGMYRMASKFLGYSGPKTKEALEQFRQSSPAVAAKMKSYSNAMARGGLLQSQGYFTGGLTNLFSNAAGSIVSGISSTQQATDDKAAVAEAAEPDVPAPLPLQDPVVTTPTSQTGATPFLPTAGLPTAPTLETVPNLVEIPDDASDTFKEEAERVNKEREDIIARNTAAQEQYKQASMDALSQAQQQAVMSTMTPYAPEVSQIQMTPEQIIASSAGQATTPAPTATAAQVGQVAQAAPTEATQAAQMETTTVQPEAAAILAGTQAATGQVSPEAQVAAATQAQTSVSNLEAAQGTAIMMDNPVQREIQAGELISGAADAAKAAVFTEQIQAAEATPTKKATVAGQLESLMQDFEGGATPAWAAGAMRSATQALAARGLGASSMAGQAVIQAAMESALPIAQMDAQTQAQFEAQNLSNRQQRAMLAAQQRAEFMGMEFNQEFQARVQNASRIADVANMNFTAEQQIALENSRAANTINLQNLSNNQAMVMAEAAALSQLDITNLNNRQQAAVQNAQNFMQMDLTNLSNEQQTTMFKAQQNLQALFTDQAAENAAAQFNASSQNQTDQFFAGLASQTNQFNASQTNAMSQFNVDAANSIRTFNAELEQQRDLFNAQNSLVVEQANAVWRQNVATLDNAAQNEANMTLAQTLNALTMANVDQIWQRERDLMSYSIQTANNNADRATQIALQKLANNATANAAEAKKSSAFASAAGSIVSSLVFG